MSEQSTPRPFPEARPPHLPDLLTRQSPWLLAFVAVVILQLWHGWTVVTVAQQVDAPSTIGATLSRIPYVVPPLLAVALFWRHPDARRTMPLLVFGLALFAVGQLLDVFEQSISAFLRGLGPSDARFDTPAQTAFRVFTTLLSAFAILYTGAGLSAARSKERSAAERPLAIWLGALAVIVTVISLAPLTQVDVEATPEIVILIVIGTILSALVTVAWAYVVTVTVGGWMAGASPRRAWGVAAAALSVLYGSNVAFALLTSLPVGDPGLTLLRIIGYGALVAWLLLLAAFVLGLPSPPSATADPPAVTQPGSATG